MADGVQSNPATKRASSEKVIDVEVQLAVVVKLNRMGVRGAEEIEARGDYLFIDRLESSNGGRLA